MSNTRHTTIVIEQTFYVAGARAEVELPDGLAWEDITDWYINRDTLHYTTGDNEWHEMELDSAIDLNDVIDWNRPQSASVYTPDYETELGNK